MASSAFQQRNRRDCIQNAVPVARGRHQGQSGAVAKEKVQEVEERQRVGHTPAAQPLLFILAGSASNVYARKSGRGTHVTPKTARVCGRSSEESSCSVTCVRARGGLVWFGLVRFGSVLIASVNFALVWFGSIGAVRFREGRALSVLGG